MPFVGPRSTFPRIELQKLALLACSALTRAVTSERAACSHLWRFAPNNPVLHCVRCGASTGDQHPGQNAARADVIPQDVIQFIKANV